MAGLGVMALLMGVVTSATATPVSIFEITDGNVLDDDNTTNPAPDWDNYLDTSPPLGPGNLEAALPAGTVAAVFIKDRLSFDPLPAPPCSPSKTGDLTVFTSGGSDKNGDAFSTLSFQSGSIPNNKDDLYNVYAVAKLDPDSLRTVLYFGLERVATNGASHIDFEFTQAPVGLVQTGTDPRGCPEGRWDGARTVGDILISVNFERGGTLGVSEVRVWSGTEYVLDTPSATAFGVTTNAVDVPCGDYICRDTDGDPTTTLLANALVEGFIDPGALSDPLEGCLTSFNVHTRSSPSFDSELKDFALGNFDTCAKKQGTKFNDLNGDGVKDAGEPGLSGWVINGYADDGNGVLSVAEFNAGPVGTDTTDVNGDYEIGGLETGDYIFCEVAQAGWTQSFPANTVCDLGGTLGNGGHAENLSQGETSTGNDFGNWTPATKSGVKFEDLDADGAARETGEPGLAGWTIYVDYDNDSTLDTGEPSAVTAANGSYTISGINPGTWNVREVGQTGWTCSFPSPCVYNETFTSGEAETGNDFGNWTPATKSGFKFYDNDRDGVYEPSPNLQNDTKLSTWAVELWRLNGSTWQWVATDITDSVGYEFTGLTPGVTYAVCEVNQANYFQSFPYSGATLPAGELSMDCSALTPSTPTSLFATYGYRFTPTSGAIFNANVFGNYLVPPGCTLTQGYWKTHSTDGPAAHPDATWDLITPAMTGGSFGSGKDSEFFDSGQTWIQVFKTNPSGGNAWYILAHQYMAAVLNGLNGAGSVPGLSAALADAYVLLDYYDGAKNISKNANNVLTGTKDRAEAIAIAEFLNRYNNGLLGVPHCGETGFVGYTPIR